MDQFRRAGPGGHNSDTLPGAWFRAAAAVDRACGARAGRSWPHRARAGL